MALLDDLNLGGGSGPVRDLLAQVRDLLGLNDDPGNGNAIDAGLVDIDNRDDGTTVAIGQDGGTLGATGAQIDHVPGPSDSSDLGGNLGDVTLLSGVDQGGSGQPGAGAAVGTFDSGGALDVTGVSVAGTLDEGNDNPAALDLTLAPDDDPQDIGFDVATNVATGDDRITGVHVDLDTNTEDGALKDDRIFLVAIDDNDSGNGTDVNIGGEHGAQADDAFVAVTLREQELPRDVVPDTGGIVNSGTIDDLPSGAVGDLPISTSGLGLDSLLDVV
jgi:hypothetical protein